MKLRIKTVDMDGYLGREFHPERSDKGLVVIALAMESYVVDPEDGNDSPTLEKNGEATDQVTNATDTPAYLEDSLVYMWTAVAPDGRTLQLMDHEVEVVL
jgi:hypothetical protein